MQIIINAGGTGTRLWPYSTNETPKQFVPLIDEYSFLRKTYNRLISAFKPEQIWVNTNIKFKNLVEESLPTHFEASHILTEPVKRDNFAAIISHAAVVAHHVGVDEPLVFVHADHLILEKDWPKFNQALKIAANTLLNKEFEIVTAAVKPKFPNTQLGYIEIDPKNTKECYEQAVKVMRFKEKPDVEMAEEFIASGNFLWNLGYFSFTYNTLLENLRKFDPKTVEIVEKIKQTGQIDTNDYLQLPKIAFDYAVAEKTPSLGVIGIDIDWEDIGNWEIAAKFLPKLVENKNQIEISGTNNKVKLTNQKRKVAFIGVSNLVLVESAEGILVIDPKCAGDVKKAAEYFENLE